MRLTPLLLAGLLASPAAARDTWTTPHPGVRQLQRTTDRPWRIFALQVDLCADGVSLRATAQGDKRRTVSSFADRVGAEAAVNGDFFSYETYDPTGLAMSGGNRWHADMRGSGEILFGDDFAWLEAPGAIVAPPPGTREAVGGRPLLVDGGAVAAEFNRADCADRHPRTAVGLSQNRRTLVLAVVDGRSGSSVGMNCRELAGLMRELGAHRAMNLDGGGSSTMWVRGTGVLNRPSDGSQRTVANHLAILASGRGSPGSCDFSEAEPVDQPAAYDTGSTDVNGDGRADACARGSAGLDCYLAAEGGAFGARWRLADLANAACGAPECYTTIRFGDLNGDGAADVCARLAEGVRCWPGGAGGFGPAIDGPRLSDESGWSRPQYYTTLRLADVTGDGQDDLCARAAAGLRCWPSNGAGFGAVIEGPALSDAEGWNIPNRYGTLRFGDVDADGRADACALAAGGLRCWRSTGDGFSAAVEGPAWSDAQGFAHVAYWSTFRLGDVDADGRADACIRSASDLRCALSRGNAFAAAVAGPGLADDDGWRDHDNYGTLRLGDVDGDGTQDACLRANARVYCWLSAPGAAFSRRIDGPELSDESGWGHFRYHSSIRLGDVTGDGRADLCARASAGFRCWPSVGDGFAASVAGPAWSDESGWDAPRYFGTVRLGGPAPRPVVCEGAACGEPDAGVPDPGGVDTGVTEAPDAGVSDGGPGRSPDADPQGTSDAEPGGGPGPAEADAADRPESDAASRTQSDAGDRPQSDAAGAGPGAVPSDRDAFVDGDPNAHDREAGAVAHDGGCRAVPAPSALLWLAPLLALLRPTRRR